MRVATAPLTLASVTPAAIGAMPTMTPTATKTSAYDAVAWDIVCYDATGGAFQINLPASPDVGDRVEFAEVGNSANTLTVGRNGNDIENAAANVTIAVAASYYGFVYISAGYGWKRY